MNRIQPVHIFPMETPTRERASYLFVSRRLKKLIIEKLARREWDFQYLFLQPMDLGKFTAELISQSGGLIVFTRNKK